VLRCKGKPVARRGRKANGAPDQELAGLPPESSDFDTARGALALQKERIHMLQKLRERMGREEGFTLIELLVVMLILGLLAAIAIPTFLNQREKAQDSDAKALARAAQTAMETYATDNGGDYTGADGDALHAIEETVPNTIGIAGPAGGPAPTDAGYTVTAESETGHTFSVERNGSAFSFPCTGEGGCSGDTWGD
jgi:type IV pilus assembly protein PilA